MLRLHLVDGTYELFRAHFSRRPPHSVAGRDLKATVGLAASLLALLKDPAEAVTHVAIAFDNPIRSVRNDWFAGYKSDESVPAELRSQFDLAEEAARAVGVVVWSMGRYEADDALATGADRFAAQVDQVRLLTPDKDLGQCLRGERVVQVDRLREKIVDEATLRRARGFGPESIPDWLALVGDDADGIPGLAGFGDRTAAALLALHPHLEDIPADARDWPTGVRGADRLARTLAEERPSALLYRRLATLLTDAPLTEDLEQLRWRGVPRALFGRWCDRLEIDSLRDRPRRWR